MVNEDNKGKKTLLIGLDGATWKIINPLIQKGKLPNLKRLMDEGAYGTLLSTDTMISPSVWTSIWTGKAPQHHGITDFMTMQNRLKAKRLWTIFEEFGKTVGIAGFMVTWPPKLKNKGFLIPDHFAPGLETIPSEVSFFREITNAQGFIDKSNFKKILQYAKKFYAYDIGVLTLVKAGKIFAFKKFLHPSYLDVYFKEVIIFQQLLEKIFMSLTKRYLPDLFAIYLPGTDVIAHKYWSFYQPEDFEDVNFYNGIRRFWILPNNALIYFYNP